MSGCYARPFSIMFTFLVCDQACSQACVAIREHLFLLLLEALLAYVF